MGSLLMRIGALLTLLAPVLKEVAAHWGAIMCRPRCALVLVLGGLNHLAHGLLHVRIASKNGLGQPFSMPSPIAVAKSATIAKLARSRAEVVHTGLHFERGCVVLLLLSVQHGLSLRGSLSLISSERFRFAKDCRVSAR